MLRKNIDKVDHIISNLGAANSLLEKYGNQVVTDSEQAAIKDIRDVLVAYTFAAHAVEREIIKGTSSSKIDKLVKVDDSLALRGLDVLQKENARQQEKFSKEQSKVLLLGELQTTLGYGGMIHAFKNYVLRNDAKYKNRALSKLQESLVIIEHYKVADFLTNSEMLALEDISVAINAYSKGVDKVQALIKSENSPEEIDANVRVDDRLALRGLNILERQLNLRIKTQANDVSLAFLNINQISQTLLIIVLVLLVLVITINAWVIVKGIANPMRQMSEVMSELAKGNVDIRLVNYSGDNEIAQMGQSISVFKENALKRIEAENSLNHANEELNAQLNELRVMRTLGDERTAKALSLAENLTVARDKALAESIRAEEEKERARAVVDTVSDCIITIDESGLIKTFNPAAELVFGYKESEVVNKNVKMLMPFEYAQSHDGFISNYLDTNERKVISLPGEKGARREVEARKKDGKIFPAELSIGVSDVAGAQLFTGVIRDISEKKEIEQLKQNFVSSVSHELRTPLTAIKGAIGLMAFNNSNRELSDQEKSLIDVTQRNIDRLSNLINDLLDFEKLEAGNLEFEFLPVNVNDILNEAVTVNEHYATNTGITFTSVGGVDALVNVDSGRIAQVMANFISNAAKFSPEGGEVTVGARRKDGNVYIYVSDEGEGVPEEFRDKMFDRFTQVDGLNKNNKGGTGLGMAISKAIIENHNGEIGFVSEMGKGTEFYFILPEFIPARV